MLYRAILSTLLLAILTSNFACRTTAKKQVTLIAPEVEKSEALPQPEKEVTSPEFDVKGRLEEVPR